MRSFRPHESSFVQEPTYRNIIKLALQFVGYMTATAIACAFVEALIAWKFSPVRFLGAFIGIYLLFSLLIALPKAIPLVRIAPVLDASFFATYIVLSVLWLMAITFLGIVPFK